MPFRVVIPVASFSFFFFSFSIIYESITHLFLCTDSDRIAEYDMKLMDIDSDTHGIPDTEYDARVTMPSSEFTRIVRDLSQLGESVRIEVSKEGVRFASEGEAANGSVLLRQEGAIVSGGKITIEKEEEKKEEKDGDEEEEEEEAEASTTQKKDPKEKVKKTKVKKEKKDDEDVEMDDEDDEKDDDADFKSKSNDEGDDGEEEKVDEEADEDEDDDEDGSSKKRKKKVTYFS